MIEALLLLVSVAVLLLGYVAGVADACYARQIPAREVPKRVARGLRDRISSIFFHNMS